MLLVTQLGSFLTAMRQCDVAMRIIAIGLNKPSSFNTSKWQPCHMKHKGKSCSALLQRQESEETPDLFLLLPPAA